MVSDFYLAKKYSNGEKQTRGAQRERDREKSLKEKGTKEKREGTGRAGVNHDGEALQKKIEEKKKLIEAGLLEEKPKKEAKEKPKAMVNPHTFVLLD